MTHEEFNKWIDHLTARFTGVGTKFAGMDGPSRLATRDAWRETLRNVEYDVAIDQSQILFEKASRTWFDDIPGKIRAMCSAASEDQRGRASVSLSVADNCEICCDSGWSSVQLFGKYLEMAARMYGGLEKALKISTAIYCSCPVGDKLIELRKVIGPVRYSPAVHTLHNDVIFPRAKQAITLSGSKGEVIVDQPRVPRFSL